MKRKPCITQIKLSGHLRTLVECRKHTPAARVFQISLVFSNALCVLSRCNTRLSFLFYLLNSPGKPTDIRFQLLHAGFFPTALTSNHDHILLFILLL